MKNQFLFKELASMPEAERNEVIEMVYKLISEMNFSLDSIEKSRTEAGGRECPYCKAKGAIKAGFLNNVQRYKCKSCGKNFRANTGTATAHLKKKALLKTYLIHFFAGKSLRECARETGISQQTSFDWRHKILAAFQHQQDSTTFSGICESDDVFFRFSEKGKKHLDRKARKRGQGVFEIRKRGINEDHLAVIISADRRGNKHLQVAKRGRVSKKDIERILENKIQPGTILCTDAHRSYTAFAKSNGIEHHTLKASAKEFKKGQYHIQHVNQVCSDLKKWIERFNGVSTKYLQNYLNWYSLIDAINRSSNRTRVIATMISLAPNAWALFKNIGVVKYGI